MNQNLKKTLRAMADKLWFSMNAAEYKRTVLDLIFHKHISDSFDERRTERLAAFRYEAGDLYLPDAANHTEAVDERLQHDGQRLLGVGVELGGPRHGESVVREYPRKHRSGARACGTEGLAASRFISGKLLLPKA